MDCETCGIKSTLGAGPGDATMQSVVVMDKTIMVTAMRTFFLKWNSGIKYIYFYIYRTVKPHGREEGNARAFICDLSDKSQFSSGFS